MKVTGVNQQSGCFVSIQDLVLKGSKTVFWRSDNARWYNIEFDGLHSLNGVNDLEDVYQEWLKDYQEWLKD